MVTHVAYIPVRSTIKAIALRMKTTQLDTDATTRNLVGATMFGVVASVCTLL